MVSVGRKIRTVLFSEARLVRDGLRALLGRERDVEIVAEGDHERDLPDVVAAAEPDVVIVTLHPAHYGTMALLKRLARECPQVRVVTLSSCCNRVFVGEVLRAGAHGYVVRRDPFDDLLGAIRVVVTGSVCLSASVRQAVVDDYVSCGAGACSARGTKLTDRERAILQFIAEGHSSKQIGRLLNLSSKTIDASRRGLMRKLQVDSVAGLVKRARVMGVTTLAE
jgi:DNA-binding NarL/FixJ family response regulator